MVRARIRGFTWKWKGDGIGKRRKNHSHATFAWLDSIGTIIEKEEPELLPFVTAVIYTDVKFKVKWDKDEYGESGWIRESELEKVIE